MQIFSKYICVLQYYLTEKPDMSYIIKVYRATNLLL